MPALQIPSWLKYPPLRNPLIAALLALPTFLLEYFNLLNDSTAIVLFFAAILIGGYLWVKEGFEKLIEKKEIGIPFLMIGATLGAIYLQMWDEAAALVVLYGIAEGIEEYTFNKTRNSIRSLLDLTPKKARRIKNNTEEMILVEQLAVGDIFRVLPGESIPTDGIILEGETNIDESLVTGESIPVVKKEGDTIFPATINLDAAITAKVTHVAADNTLARIINLVENAQEQKGEAQAWMERFGKIYTPAVLLIALIMIGISFYLPENSAYWIEKAVIFLVTAAPCALVISLPIAMAAGISGAAKHGVLIKGGAHLEHLGSIQTVAFDKTGTLTYGKPNVTDVIPLNSDEEKLIGIAAGLEQHSAHPLAEAVLKYAKEHHIPIHSASQTKAIFGFGVEGYIETTSWYMGNRELFETMGIDLHVIEEKIKQLQSDGKTVMLVGNSKEIIGIIAVLDTIRENAPQVIQKLHQLGIKTVMLTGDNKTTAKRIAQKLQIDDFRAELKPDDKVAAIKELMSTSATLMVGDGVNDAPALATATCGVAMGAAGSDAAIEAADIALMADDLSKIEAAIQIGKQAKKVSRQNIVFSIIVLAVLIPAGLGGIISVSIAVLIHEVSELLAVANGLRAGNIQSALH